MHPNRSAISATAAIIFLSITPFSVVVAATELPPCPPLKLPPALHAKNVAPSSVNNAAPRFSESQQQSASVAENTPEMVTIQLSPGLLKPQLELLLKNQWQIQNFIWLAAQEHYWPTHYTMRAVSWDALLETLITPYQLRIALHANHTAVIDYLPNDSLAQRAGEL